MQVKRESRGKLDTICFIETNKHGSSLEAIKAAKNLGYYTVLFTEKKSFLTQKNEYPFIADIVLVEIIHEQIIHNELKRLLQSGTVIQAILSFVDPHVSLAANLMNKICGTDISVEALKIMEDKGATRKALANNRATPTFQVFHETDDIYQLKKLDYPKIVKSALSSSSKDVYLIESFNDIQNTIEKLNRLYPAQDIVIEDYLKGEQYLLEVIVQDGKLHIVAIFKQSVTKEIKFIVTGYEIRHDLPEEFQKKLYETVTAILEDLNATNVTCHLEMKYHNGEWKLVEINPRISGGAMNDMLFEAMGISLVAETIKLYLGLEPNLTPKYKRFLYTHFITIGTCGYLVKITGEKRAVQLPGVKKVYIKPRVGQLVMPAVSMGHRYGYVIATGASAIEAKSSAINATRKIRFYIEEV